MLEEQKELLIRLSQEYYSGIPSVSDEEFDAMLKSFLEAGGEPLGTASGYVPTGDTFPHMFGHVGSLGKINAASLPGFNEFRDDEEVVLMPKEDGGSVVAYYFDGDRLRVLSRGNGDKGFDITANVSHCVPKKISLMGNVAVRGEVMLSWEDFDAMTPINPATGVRDGHPRNKAIGLSQALYADPNQTSKLRFVAYTLLPLGSAGNKSSSLAILKAEGFSVVKSFIDSWSYLKQLLEGCQNNLEFFSDPKDNHILPFDGLVIASNGDESKSIAYKFVDESALTTILSIEYSLTATGKLAPVGLIEPVKLCGATISRVTLNNVQWMKTNFPKKIGVGSQIRLVRANMIIPRVVEVLTESDDQAAPEVCPDCGTKLELDGAHIWCKNLNCGRYANGMHAKMCGSFAPKFLGSSILDEFYQEFAISSLTSLRDFLDGRYPAIKNSGRFPCFTDHASKLLMEMCDSLSKHTPTLSQVLGLSAISDLGDSGIASFVKSVSKEEFSEIVRKGVWSSLPESWRKTINSRAFSNLQVGFERVRGVFFFFNGQIADSPKGGDNPNIGVTWAMTGKLVRFETREALAEKLRALGILWDGPSKKTTYFVCNVPSSSEKYKQAVAYGIPIVTEDEFVRFLKEKHGVCLA